MPRSFRISLITLILLTASAAPVLARMVIGITPAVMPGATNKDNLAAFEQALATRLGEPTRIRVFDSEAAQLDWLTRYRELDAALVSRSLLRTLPAGTLVHLVDLPAAVAVTHPGAAIARQEALGRAFRGLLEDEAGRRLLARLGSAAPVAAPPPGMPERQPTKVESPVPPKPAPLPAAVVAVQPTAAPPPPVTAQPLSKPAAPPAATATGPAPAAAAPADKPPVRAAPGRPQPVVTVPAEAPAVEPVKPKRTGLLLLAALAVMIGIGVKSVLLMRHWERQTKVPAAPPEPPAAEDFAYAAAGLPATPPLRSSPNAVVPEETVVERAADWPAAAAAAPRLDADASPAVAIEEAAAQALAPAPAKRPPAKRKTAAAKGVKESFPPLADDLVVEQGRLGRTKVPALLKRCAELPQPVILRVRSEGSETCLHFAAGQICHAGTRNWRSDEATRQWSKLGYLMVRDGLISETQRDQALELVERQPGLRFAAALQQIGALDLEALRHILARQAKTAVFALILFSSGEYRIEADTSDIPAEESIAVQVEPLIREASHHQAEWTGIRKTLPTLGIVLDFAPDGREKLEQVRLSVHQQLLLAQVDGQTALGGLCSDSTMMDYEACRFLYMMAKAGVLQVTPAA